MPPTGLDAPRDDHAPTFAIEGLPRRTLLSAAVIGLAGVATVAGCGSDQSAPEAIEIKPSAPEPPEGNLLDELALIGAYLGVINAFPQVRGSLTTIADQHRAHALELGASSEELDAVKAIVPAAVALRPAVAELIAREKSAAQMRADAAMIATDSNLIRALTFIAASESSHIVELRDVRAGA